MNLSKSKICIELLDRLICSTRDEDEDCEKSRRMMRRGGLIGSQYSLMLCPVLSVWECIVRKMRYSFRPEWV